MKNAPRAANGFTIVEILIAATLGLVVLAGVAGIFVSTSRNYRESQKASSIDDELSAAMAQISEDVELAGFWASLGDPSAIVRDSLGGRDYYRWSINPASPGTPTVSGSPGLTVTADCGPQPALTPGQTGMTSGANNNNWTYDGWPAVTVENNLTSATSGNFGCITDAFGSATVPTDIIAIRRVNGLCNRSVDTGGVVRDCSRDPLGVGVGTTLTGGATGLTPDRVYLRTNGVNGVLYRYTAGAPNPPATTSPAGGYNVAATYSDWEYRVSIYYIRNYAVTSTDGIPTLCRKYLRYDNAGPTYATECFAQGIESLQVEFGLDDNTATGAPVTPPNVGDGIADRYVSNPTAVQQRQIVSVRISLLARSVDLSTGTNPPDTLLGRNAAYTDAKTYAIGDAPAYTPGDNFKRKLISGVVLLRNPTNLRTLNGAYF